MKKIIFFTSIFLFSIQNYGNTQWVNQYTSINTTGINAITFSDSLMGIATGFHNTQNGGRILYTSNAGTNWNFSNIPDSINTVNGAKIVSQSLFYACGNTQSNVLLNIVKPVNAILPFGFQSEVKEGFTYKGIFLASTDNGISWKAQGNVPNNVEYFTKFDFLNANYGFANASIGNLSPIGAIFKTTNAGENWQQMILPTSVYYMYSIKVIDSLNIISVGTKYTEIFPNQIYSGIILKTTNGGSTWTSQLFPDVNLFSSVNFINNLTGIAVGNSNPTSEKQYGGSIYKTTDKGENWFSISTNLTDTTYLRTVKFLSNGLGIISGNRLKVVVGSGLVLDKISVLKSTNFGTNWVRNYINDNNKIPHGLELVNSQKHFIGGGNLQNSATIYYTSNGGETFISNNANEVPKNFILHQNYPNPFNPTTTIEFSLSKSEYVLIQVYSINGKVIGELVNGYKRVGNYSVTFNGEQHASGVYYYSFQTANFKETKKMLLVK